MMQTMRRAVVLILAAVLPGGCGGKARQLAEPKELALAQGVEVARVDYQFRLEVLRDQMKAAGDLRKQLWAERELENLTGAHDLAWGGLAKISPPERATLAQANTPLLVEYVVSARQTYLKAMDTLLSLYQSTQDRPNVKRVQDVLDRFNPMRTYLYYLTAEIPPADLRADQAVLVATDMFDSALAAFNHGKKAWVVGDAARAKHIEAFRGFRQVVRKHPTSNKIARSAFFLAEVYRIYGEYERAAVWYDRAWQWDARVPDPARYRAATLYDFKLKDADKALEYYNLAVLHDRNRDNVDYARERIRDLTRK